ncbi:MAG: DSD1 family PLP-dependent enzyme [Promethearchaeota archaeon]
MEDSWKEKISTPALIIDYDLMLENINTMAKLAQHNGVKLRPHVKTHKCPEIAKLQLEAGASGICVAKVGEAEVFAKEGFDDILIANQVVDLGHIKRLIKLNKKSLVRVCVDSKKNITDLNAAAEKAGITLEVVMEIDIGLGRNGVKPGEPTLLLADSIKENKSLKLVGLQGYEGHLISVLDENLRKKLTEDCMQNLLDARDILNDNGYEINYLTASNTATCKFSAKVKGITEVQPGTYIFNDEHHERVVSDFKIAATVLAGITNNPGRRVYTMDAGLKAITTDNGNPIFKKYPKSKIRIMTEEHGIFKSGPKEIFELGQKVELIPSHICTTVNLYDFFTVIRNGVVFAKWDIAARGKNY